MSFLSQIFREKLSAAKPIFGPKNVNSVKTTLYFGLQKPKDALLFPFFTKNNCSFTHILSKNVHSLKNTLFSCPCFVKKTSVPSKTQCSHFHILSKNVSLSKTQCFHVMLSKFFMKNPLLSCPYLIKKATILSKLHFFLLWVKKVNKISFFSDFSR